MATTCCDGISTALRHAVVAVSSGYFSLSGEEADRIQSETMLMVFQVEYTPHVTVKSSCCAVDPLTRSCNFVALHLWLSWELRDEATECINLIQSDDFLPLERRNWSTNRSRS